MVLRHSFLSLRTMAACARLEDEPSAGSSCGEVLVTLNTVKPGYKHRPRLASAVHYLTCAITKSASAQALPYKSQNPEGARIC